MLQFLPSTHDSLTIFLCESGLFSIFNDILGLPSDIRDLRDRGKQRKTLVRTVGLYILEPRNEKNYLKHASKQWIPGTLFPVSKTRPGDGTHVPKHDIPYSKLYWLEIELF
jgi:hypothetical protein